MKLDKLQKLYINELRDLYNAENQLLKALPKMAKAASSPELKQAFEKHLEQTKSHVERLEQVFEDINEKPKGKTCHGMKGLIEEGSEILQEEGDESVIDAGIIVAAQKVEHYEIAGYGSVRTFAELLGKERSAELLQTTLNEESETQRNPNEPGKSGGPGEQGGQEGDREKQERERQQREREKQGGGGGGQPGGGQQGGGKQGGR